MASTIKQMALSMALCTVAYAADAQVKLDSSQQRPVEGAPATTDVDWAAFEKLAKVNLRFAGDVMTDARAKSISEAAGFEFIGWSTCAGLQDCFVATVRGSRGAIFRYVVSGQSCLHVAESMTPRAVAQGDAVTKPSPVQKTRSRRTGQGIGPRSDRVEVPRSEQLGETNAGAAKQKHCFGFFTAIVRARQHNSFVVDSRSHFFKSERIWQVLEEGKWNEQGSVMLMDWTHPRPDSGEDEIGFAYEVTDAAGNVLTAEQEVVYRIAGSSSEEYKRDRAEMCEQERNKVENRLAKRVYARAYIICAVVPMPMQMVVEIGEGIVVGGGKEVDWCTMGQNYFLEDVDEIAQATYDDCMNNPGRYDPKNFGHVPDPFSLESVLGAWEPLQPITVTGQCTLTKKTEITNQAAGWTCTVTTWETCQPEKEDCPCTVSDATQTCTSGGDIGTPIE